MATPSRIGFTWRGASATSKGNVRAHNEDSILDLSSCGLWVVADGMGGHNAGDVASRMIVESLAGFERRASPSALLDDLEDRLTEVNRRLYAESLVSDAGMSGSTIVALLAFERHCISVWAGDSRVYRSRGGVIEQITRDHSEAQEAIDGGSPESSAASNVITRAVGGAQELYLDIELRELRNKDRYLLCSDGLYRELSENDMAQHLTANDPEGACKALMKQALGGPCSDNVSVIVVEFSGA
ncbi:serine/threonine-protein phosphatase [Steroidobacter sp. S1-65]|uniref:Serine/threonine-protein phosphatase n=1 Tax=Steroidobacter gossypii TaxID=2805490 RepID=A0ABS1X0I3_9GAMM|nr:protein phosphatase 2C domain-containing protein [Steroidobacter gossypii]MBM0106713.1 serine/threonine-protein phosphatase [Steroidobacter gossypii]